MCRGSVDNPDNNAHFSHPLTQICTQHPSFYCHFLSSFCAYALAFHSFISSFFILILVATLEMVFIMDFIMKVEALKKF